MSLAIDVLGSVAEVEASAWDRLRRDAYPFLRHDFLLGLERSDCTTAAAGWEPSHLRLRDGGDTLAILPAWRKSHSYGEYVFDWAWADAWRRMGLAYYPKLLTAAPFTPATGPRLLHDDALDPTALWSTLAEQMPALARQLECSSWHVLFPRSEDANALAAAGLHTRHQVQFHWYNYDYRDFDDFLERFASRKRKALRRERRRVDEQGLTLRMLDGDELEERDWAAFHRFYQMTYAKRSGHGGYLTREFFLEVAPRLGKQVLMALAEAEGRAVAGALYFRDADTLYGRYWGCLREYDCLHFEACYYQGIEYCIREGLKRFDPGAQGEHKIQRGFEPTTTLSSHWVAQRELNDAIGDFTRREQAQVERYREDACTLLPFKAGGG
ncbi:MAG: GNAT family N-acetyltransferase [Halieaceae bacterium]|jgi:predicted N-acyltransferase|nr:GNAT family N-acetyltransferase [Halieaceae bacterium]